MLKSEQNDEVCDATKADVSIKADNQSLTINEGMNDLSSPFGGQGAFVKDGDVIHFRFNV